jgi:hypothetical protein
VTLATVMRKRTEKAVLKTGIKLGSPTVRVDVLPVIMSAPVVEKDQQDPQDPWFFTPETGTEPAARPERERLAKFR